MQFFIVQTMGPLAFIVRELNSSTPNIADSEVKNGAEISQKAKVNPFHKDTGLYKVGLGSRQTCSCPIFQREKEICIHLLWIMMKVYKLDKDNEILYQLSLVEREIDEMIKNKTRYVWISNHKTNHFS